MGSKKMPRAFADGHARIVPDFGLTLGKAIEKCRLSHIGVSDQYQLGNFFRSFRHCDLRADLANLNLLREVARNGQSGTANRANEVAPLASATDLAQAHLLAKSQIAKLPAGLSIHRLHLQITARSGLIQRNCAIDSESVGFHLHAIGKERLLRLDCNNKTKRITQHSQKSPHISPKRLSTMTVSDKTKRQHCILGIPRLRSLLPIVSIPRFFPHIQNIVMTQNYCSRPSRTLITTSLTLLASTGTLFAQEGEKTALDKYILDGGPTMIFIGLAILALIALCVFNFINLTRNKFCSDDLKEALMEHMTACRVRSAIELAASHPSYLGRMLAYSLPNVDATQPETLGRDHIEDAMADFSINENRKNMTWVNYIALVAQAAPMLGLLGTVIGMVSAFGTLGETGQADPAQLAGDISVALLTTMWGLITALPALIAYFFFKTRLNSLVADSHHAAEEMVNASLQTVNAEAYEAKIPEGLAV
jgi:biopolymer transport protein ExbB